MVATAKRDNAYWAERLEKDGHGELLARVRSGEISMYKASQLAGYRSKGSPSPAAKLSHHWKRASAEERLRFVRAHGIELNRVLKELVEENRSKAQKSSA